MRFERIATTAGTLPVTGGPSIADTAPDRWPDRRVPRGRRPGRVASDRASRFRLQVFDLLAPWVVGAATLVARLATRATGPTDWDSAQYVAAVSRFDVNHGRPQPPGYWLYVVTGRLVHASGLGTVESLVLVSALASALAAGLVVVAGRDLGGRWVGLAAGAVVATSPFAWFSGSIVSTYSFDLAVAPLLIILAWRARPGSWHGPAALAALGLVTGFRQSVLVMFAPLALIAVAGSVRRVRHAVVAVVAGVVAVTAWFVPMVLAQPGGFALWSAASRTETRGALRTTSILDGAAGARLNLGTFAAYTTLALAPLAALALVSAAGLGARALVRRAHRDRHPPGGSLPPHTPAPSLPPPTGSPRPVPGVPAHRRRRWADWIRPWYQSRTAILVGATLPTVAMVALVQFAKGGYLLAYLPGAVIALLLVPAVLLGSVPGGRRAGSRSSGVPSPSGATGRQARSTGAVVWGVVATTVVVAVAVVGADRFLTADGVLPGRVQQGQHGVWIAQARYQAPYADTREAIRSADAMNSDLARLDPSVDPTRDVVAIDSADGGTVFYRNAGWALPRQRVTLIVPGAAVYNEQGGSLFYTSTPTVPVGPGGYVYLIASPRMPGLRALAGTGKVALVRAAGHLGGYLVWRISPGASLLGVHVTVVHGPRPLGTGLVG